MKFLNEQQILDQWGPVLEEAEGVTDSYKKNWLSRYCHNHSLHESFTYNSTATLGNVPGMGAVKPAATLGGPLGFHTGSNGSGDKFPSLLPMAIQIGARTVGFDIVNVIPMNGPTGVLAYMDYIYTGGNIGTSEKPYIIKIDAGLINSTAYVVGTHYWGVSAANDDTNYASGTKAVELIYIGKSRIDGYPIFRVGKTYATANTTNTWAADSDITLSDVFDQAAVISTTTSGKPTQTSAATTSVAVTAKAELVTALEDHIQGFTGAGTFDADNWTGNAVDGTQPANPMSRATGENTYYRSMGLRTFTKFVEAETMQATAEVTTEQIQDLSKQYGIDVVAMVENALINEVSQSINKHILSRAFALGWSNNKEFYDADGETVNFSLDRTELDGGTSPAYINKQGFTSTIAYNAFEDFGDFENKYTIQRRIQGKILYAGNIVNQRGRRGAATFAVTNIQIATALQDSAQFTFAPMQNSLSQSNSTLYPVGSIANITIYVDPNMKSTDNRILVGRKGADDEPGLKFMPYLMAESISTIAENTMAPKLALKSRYALVEAGYHPQTQYYTIYVHTGGTKIV